MLINQSSDRHIIQTTVNQLQMYNIFSVQSLKTTFVGFVIAPVIFILHYIFKSFSKQKITFPEMNLKLILMILIQCSTTPLWRIFSWTKRWTSHTRHCLFLLLYKNLQRKSKQRKPIALEQKLKNREVNRAGAPHVR